MPAPLTQQSGSNVSAYSEAGEGGDGLSLTFLLRITFLQLRKEIAQTFTVSGVMSINCNRKTE